MTHDLSEKKVRTYTFAFYILLLLTEITYNVFSYITTYQNGKLTGSLFAKMQEALSLLKFDIAFYVAALFLVYLFFAWINYKFVIFAAAAIQRRGILPRLPTRALLFVLINAFFLVSVYYLNYAVYSFSKINRFANLIFDPYDYKIHYIIALSLMALFFLILFYVFLRHGTKKSRILGPALVALLLLANLHPVHHIRRLIDSLDVERTNTGPNVFLIGLDSFTPHHTSYFGYPHATTPHLDRFLAENIVFTNAFTPLARTTASWYSILTGQYPRNNGVRYNLMSRKYIDPRIRTISSFLKDERGWFTAHATDETRFCNLTEDDGFSQMKHPEFGVKDFIFSTVHDFSLPNVFFNHPLGHILFDFMKDNRSVYHLYRPGFFSDDLGRFYASFKKREKVFAVVHYCAAHWPYQSPYPYANMFLDEKNYEYSAYNGTVRMADDQFGRLIATIKRSGLYDDALIIVLSDHGETINGHGTDLKESQQNNIILAVKLPNGKKHKEVTELVRTVDLAPTILEVLGEDASGFAFDGESLLGLMEDKPDRSPWEEIAFMETGFSVDVPGGVGLAFQDMINRGVAFYEFNDRGVITVREDLHPELIARKQRAVQTPEWKLVVDPAGRRAGASQAVKLFRCTNDPECDENVADAHPDVVERLLARLKEFYGEELILRDADGD
jgi:arylsulfatase A-like enzyme